MALRRIGFFRELRHGDPAGPSLAEARNARNYSLSKAGLVICYLNGGYSIAVSPKLISDYFDEKCAIGTLSILTDGTWAWPSDLAYYVAKYSLFLDVEFVDLVTERNGLVPNIDISLVRIAW